MIEETLRLKATGESVEIVLDKTNEILSNSGCPDEVRRNIDVAVEEICGNIVAYAYPDGAGDFSVCISVGGNKSEFVFIDRGIAFNPLESNLNVEPINLDFGGVGIILAKELTDSMDYEYINSENRLHFIKAWE